MCAMATPDITRSNGGLALSPRELVVLEMASQGLTNSAIAEKLGVSVHVVKFHLAAIYRKLGVANRTEAAITFVRWNTAENGSAQASAGLPQERD
jgi:DNA-binding NarL/FixJ family response regulator